ncbi:hypothetical protein [Acidipropionibacterium jensenii]|nr:hypothetical protein [Acidipropionibacterium jensenii]
MTPLAVTILACAGAAIAPMFVDFTTVQLLQVVLATLALIGGSLLAETIVEARHRREHESALHAEVRDALDAVRRNSSPSADLLFLSRKALAPLEDRIADADTLRICGGSLFRLMNEYSQVFEQRLRSGTEIKFLLTDPESDAAAYLARHVVYEVRSVDSYRANIRDAIAEINRLCQDFPGKCHLRLLDLAPPFSIFDVGRVDSPSTAHVELYSLGSPTRSRPIITLNEVQDPISHAFFRTQFDCLWEIGHEYSED